MVPLLGRRLAVVVKFYEKTTWVSMLPSFGYRTIYLTRWRFCLLLPELVTPGKKSSICWPEFRSSWWTDASGLIITFLLSVRKKVRTKDASQCKSQDLCESSLTTAPHVRKYRGPFFSLCTHYFHFQRCRFSLKMSFFLAFPEKERAWTQRAWWREVNSRWFRSNRRTFWGYLTSLNATSWS